MNTDFEARNPEGPPMTPEEIAELLAWHASLALPAVELLPAPERPVTAGGTRIGGPVWLPDGEGWPVDADGASLEFVAQVDFGDLPPLPDFPTTGLLQFFVGRDDRHGVDRDDPTRGSARVLWWPNGLAGGGLHPQPGNAGEPSPFGGSEVRATGLPLAGRPAEHLPGKWDWRIDARLEGHLRRPGAEEIYDRLCFGGENAQPVAHHVGGHPAFAQFDFRKPGRFDDFDRTLLRLTSDDFVSWDDYGEAVFLIRRRDLLMRDFSAAIFYWDCS